MEKERGTPLSTTTLKGECVDRLDPPGTITPKGDCVQRGEDEVGPKTTTPKVIHR